MTDLKELCWVYEGLGGAETSVVMFTAVGFLQQQGIVWLAMEAYGRWWWLVYPTGLALLCGVLGNR